MDTSLNTPGGSKFKQYGAKRGEWVRRKNFEHSDDKPVHLSEEDKNFIIDLAGELVIPGSCEESVARVKASIKDEIARQLGTVMIIPNRFYIEILVSRIVNSYVAALADDFYVAGMIAGTSISSAGTQSTLSSFKLKSGASLTVEGGIAGLTTLIYTRLSRKNDARMIVHFTLPVSKKDIIDMRALLVSVSAAELVDSYLIGKMSPVLGVAEVDSLERFWWHDLQLKNPDRPAFKMVSPQAQVLRLFLNKSMLYTHQITPRKMADTIALIKGGVEASSVNNPLVTIYGPFDSGIIDIIIIPENISDGPSNSAEEATFLRHSIHMKLSDVVIKGITGITDLYPKEYSLLKLIVSESKIDATTYVLRVNAKDNKVFEGIFPAYHRLEHLMSSTGIKIIRRIRDDFSREIVGYEVRSFNGYSPMEILALFDLEKIVEEKVDNSSYKLVFLSSKIELVSDVLKAITVPVVGIDYLEGRKKVVTYINISRSPVEILREKGIDTLYHYMITSGSNYDSIVKLPWVDPLRSTPNDIFEIYRKMGCEAARNYFLYELILVLESIKSKDINSRHISLTTDVIFVEGRPAGATFTGNIVRGVEPLSLATGQRGPKTLTDAAAKKKKERLINTSAALIVGVPVAVGKEGGRVNSSIEYLREFKRKKEEMEKERALITKETEGYKLSIRENNERLLSMLSPSRAVQAPQELELVLTVETNTDREKEGASQVGETEIIDESLVETAFVGGLSSTAITPTIVPRDLTSVLVKEPVAKVTTTPVPYQTVTDVPTGIRNRVADRVKFNTLSYYASLLTPRYNATGAYGYEELAEILSIWMPVVRENIEVVSVVPKMPFDISRRNVTPFSAQLSSSREGEAPEQPKPLSLAKEPPRFYEGRPGIYYTDFSLLSNREGSLSLPLDTIINMIPNFKALFINN
jgi:hypothetical protein